MLGFSQIGKKGNLGNQLFQIASTIGIAKKNGHEFVFPEWEYNKYFENPIPVGALDNTFQVIEYEDFEYCDKSFGEGNYDLSGWLQTERYFDVAATRHYFTFKKEAEKKVLEKYAGLFEKETILISVRRGDFVRNPKFHQLSYKFYFGALIRYFPHWERCNLVFISDHLPYCKKHFRTLPNTIFVDDLSPIEQLILATNCDHFIVSNSTFSWWAAWLGEHEHSKVICPHRNFARAYQLENDKDYYPERWIKFDEKDARIPFKYWRIRWFGSIFEIAVSIRHQLRKVSFFKKLIDG